MNRANKSEIKEMTENADKNIRQILVTAIEQICYRTLAGLKKGEQFFVDLPQPIRIDPDSKVSHLGAKADEIWLVTPMAPASVYPIFNEQEDGLTDNFYELSNQEMMLVLKTLGGEKD